MPTDVSTKEIDDLVAIAQDGRLAFPHRPRFGRHSHTRSSCDSGSSGWFAPRIDIESSWPLFDDFLRLIGAGTLAMPLIRKEFSVSGVSVGIVHQPDPVIGRLGAGLELLWR